MRKIPLLTTLAAAIGAGALIPGSPATASGPAATKGTERISIVSTSISAPAASLIARGAFTAGGKFIFSNTGGTVKLPDGSFKVTTASDGKTSVDPATCLVSHTYKTKYKLSDGTRAYKHITGSGTADVSEHAILPRTASGNCNENANPTVFQAVINATGPVNIP